jgi:hypothetical protein
MPFVLTNDGVSSTFRPVADKAFNADVRAILGRFAPRECGESSSGKTRFARLPGSNDYPTLTATTTSSDNMITAVINCSDAVG